MSRILFWVLLISIFFAFPVSKSEDLSVRKSLVQFMDTLSPGTVPHGPNWGWNLTSDPCSGKWMGVSCHPNSLNIRRIVLEGFNFTGSLDASSVCTTPSLAVLSLMQNGVTGPIPEEIRNCRHLTHLFLGGNRLNGNLPKSLSQLNNLKRIDISNNDFSGELPDLVRISGLVTFLAQDNQLSGPIPDFDFLNFDTFNVSNNNFSGPIPDVKGKFSANSFSGNPGLCGNPLSITCQQPPPPSPIPPATTGSKRSTTDRFLIYSGYIILVMVLLLLIVLIVIKKKKPKKEVTAAVPKKRNASDSNNSATTNSKPSETSSEYKAATNRSEYSITSVENGLASSSLILLPSQKVDTLRFEDLLRAPAELLGRGKHGSLYKVMLDDRLMLAVKRIKDWDIPQDEFKSRIKRIHQVQHPRVLPPIALYSSQQEKLLVYEFQPNGSLFKLLHGSQNGKKFDWGSRLSVAATIAGALAFMHEALQEDKIAHGNLKSTNIVFDMNMEPCISEYGLMQVDLTKQETMLSQTESFRNNIQSRTGGNINKMPKAFRDDVYSFGVILLELLTGKLVQNNGFDLATWVYSVVREEWTAEVFDRSLISEAASEERMVSLLQVALKCINPSSKDRPNMNQVALMINAIKEDEEERSIAPSDS